MLLAGLCCSSICMAAQAVVPSINAARSLVQQGDDGAALAQLKQLIAADATQYQAWFLQGMIQTRQQQFHDAIASFQQVIRLQPTLAAPHNNLAVIYNEMGDYRAAVKALEASLALNPNYQTAQENIGDLYVKLAADAYKKALALGNSPRLRQRYEHLLSIHQPAAAQSHKTNKTNTTPAAQASADISAALAVVERWRAAWSKRDPDAYFANYSELFTPAKCFASRLAWMNYKRWSMQKRTYIKVDLENMLANKIKSDVIRVVFLQHFRSDSFNSNDLKELILKKTQGQWKIIHEASR